MADFAGSGSRLHLAVPGANGAHVHGLRAVPLCLLNASAG